MKSFGAKGAALPVEALRAIDRHAIEILGIPGAVLMENAGAGAARVALQMLDEVEAPLDSTCLVLCGSGGNGGDGYVVARHLALAGRRVLVVHASESSSGDAALMREIVVRMGLDQVTVATEEGFARFRHEGRGGAIYGKEERCALLVDALLGTGIRVPLRPLMNKLIGFVAEILSERGMKPTNRDNSRTLGLALDLPSGMDADSRDGLGCPILGIAKTVTFAARKLAFNLPQSDFFTGDVEICSIGAPVEHD